MTLTEQTASYVAMKRAAGRSFTNQERHLSSFAAHAEAHGDRFIQIATVLDWALQASSQSERVFRVHVVCGFAEYLHAEDKRHEIPHRDALGRRVRHRPPPHLLSVGQIRQIMNAALELPPADSLTPHTFYTIIGVLAATGMRRSEAVGLRNRDLTVDGVEIHNAKFGKARLIPLDETVKRALDAYLKKRGLGEPDDPVFIMPSGRAVNPDYLTEIFIKLARRVGLRGEQGVPGPRLHDLRHSFAMRVLTEVSSNNRRDISRQMLALSTYLGHASIGDTYWYLEATPVLLKQISTATEALHECHAGRRNDD